MRQTTCYHCRAPLPLAEGVTVVDCQYCKTKNDLRRWADQARDAHAPRPPRYPKALAGVVIAVIVAGVATVVWTASPDPAPAEGGTAAPAKPPGLELEWVSDNEFTPRGLDDMRGQVRINAKAEYRLTLRGFPERTRWRVGETRGLVQTPSFTTGVIADVRDELGNVPVASARTHGVGPQATLEIELPSGRAGTIELVQAPAMFAVLAAFEQVRDQQPLRFVDEPEPRERPSVLYHRSVGPKVFGPAETFAQVDLVAFRQELPEVLDEVECTFERRGETSEQTFRIKASEVRVYDRRTAELLHTKRFVPSSDCPTMRMGDAPTFTRGVTIRDVEPWLRALIEEG